MLLRLFDGHPDVHVRPAPLSFHWPRRPKPEKVREAFSMTRFNEAGFAKSASKRDQPPAPIDFDETAYRKAFDRASKKTARKTFDAAFRACFDSWRNYRHNGNKHYAMMHSTMWSHTKAVGMVDRFFLAYPDGWMVFIARPPADWLASGLKLGGKLSDPASALEEYCSAYRMLLEAREVHGKRMIVLPFNTLVRDPKPTLRSMCETIGIAYNQALETTTINGTPIEANSSHDGEPRYSPDPSLIGHGAAIMGRVENLPGYAEADRIYRETIMAESA